MSARLAFVLVTAHEPAPVVEQLIDLLDPFPVVVQHDFRAQPGFSLRPRTGRVHWVPAARAGAWGTWEGVDATAHAVRHALKATDADYVQLISGSCLPLRPVQAFARHVTEQDADANAGWFDAFETDDTMMAYGWRLVGAHANAMGRRVLRRLSCDWFREPPVITPRAGLELPIRQAPANPIDRAKGVGALAITRAALQQRMDQVPEALALPPVFGCGWIGARRRAWEYMLRRLAEPDTQDWLRPVHSPDEHAWVALLAGSKLRVGPLNHLTGRFAAGGRSLPMATQDLARIDATSAFFGRRFAHDAADPVRFAVVSRLQQGEFKATARLRVIGR